MKAALLPLVVSSLLIAATPAFGESSSATPVPPSAVTIAAQQPEPKYTAFDLDFSGGTPAQLVAAIERASGRTLNAIIPAEYSEVKLPPMKMKNITTPDLFAALSATSFPTGAGYGSYAFQSRSRKGDDSVWYFSASIPPSMMNGKTTRYFSLAPFLGAGLNVDDITTAIQTGWKMRGETQPMSLSYHKETKLLIAAGDNAVFQTIESALQALSTQIPQKVDVVTSRPVQTPEQERRRLEAVAEEVSRRRAEREATQKGGRAVVPTSPKPEAPTDESKTKE